MLSILSTSNTLEQWLFIIVLVLMLGSTMGLLAWGAILEIRYISPFTLIKTSNKEKWRKATILALMVTAMLPIFGLAMLIIYTPAERLPMFLICNGLWIIALPITILYKRWEFEKHIKSYLRLDKMIKENSVHTRFLPSPLTSIVSFFMNSEQKRFFKEGFPIEIDEKKDNEFYEQEKNEISKAK